MPEALRRVIFVCMVLVFVLNTRRGQVCVLYITADEINCTCCDFCNNHNAALRGTHRGEAGFEESEGKLVNSKATSNHTHSNLSPCARTCKSKWCEQE